MAGSTYSVRLRNGLRRLRRVILPVLTALLLLIVNLQPALAIDGKKTAKALAQQAAKAFEAGEMDRAAQAYLEAWHTDGSEPNYLYGAARAEQSAGQGERAEEHYRQFIALGTADPARVAKAKGYLTEFAGVRSDEKVQAGDRAAKRSEWPVAAAAYSEAWQLRQDRLAVLLKAARAAKEAGNQPQAETWLRSYLERAPPNAPDRAEAQAMLDAAVGKPVVVAPRPVESVVTPPPPRPVEPVSVAPQVSAPQEKPSGRRTAGLWTLGSGGALAIAGAVLLGLGKAQEGQFNSDLNYDGTVVHGALTYDQATSRAQSIGTLQTSGVALLATGALAAGVGAYLVLTAGDAKVAVLPQGQGFALAGRF